MRFNLLTTLAAPWQKLKMKNNGADSAILDDEGVVRMIPNKYAVTAVVKNLKTNVHHNHRIWQGNSFFVALYTFITHTFDEGSISLSLTIDPNV